MTHQVLWTIGHSTRALEELTALLHEHGVLRLWDVRTVPRSRHNPQYDTGSLQRTLPAAGIAYAHHPELGGLRKPRRDSLNLGWKSDGFRGYADYMQTPEFERAIAALMAEADGAPTAVMCAEAVPERCHRSLIADALHVRGVEVRHILGPGKVHSHALTGFAQPEGTRVTYPFALEG